MVSHGPEPRAPRDPAIQAITETLSAPFEVTEVKFKPQMVKNNRALAIAYLDVRHIQDRLDWVLGAENWQDDYDILPDGSVTCRLRLNLGGQWVTKMDVGSPSEQPDGGDRLKAAFSDALKRAAVKFGIGRYLYRLPAQWVEYDPIKKQITQLPRLPAFAIPRTSSPPTATPRAKQTQPTQTPSAPTAASASPALAATPAPATNSQGDETAPAASPASPPATPTTAPSTAPSLPSTGAELHRRLQEYDAKLASQKLCQRGALLAHVSQAGIKAGYSANITEWSGPAIPFAVNTVKEFEQLTRSTKSPPQAA